MKKPKINFNLKKLLGIPTTLSQKFHDLTKIKKMSQKEPNPKNWPKEWTTVYFKEYPRLDKIILPEIEELTLPNITLKQVLQNRSSNKAFFKSPIDLEKIGSLLYFSAGQKKFKPPWQSNRFYPSAGSRYPLEVYLISLNSDLLPGLYHLNITNNSLEILLTEEIKLSKYFNQDWIEKAGIIILITAVFDRTTIKYGDRGYRHVLTESGSLIQNFYLIATALNLNCCAIGGFLDNKINELLDIDGVFESTIATLAIGTKK